MIAETVEIRATGRYAYRPGEWAELLNVTWITVPTTGADIQRMCYEVLFPTPSNDGKRVDYWPLVGGSPYEFRNKE
jgi:hypothetical protein